MGIDSTYGQVLRLPTARMQSCEVRRCVPRPGEVALQEAQAARADDLSVTAFVLSALPATQRTVLWLQDRASGQGAGRLYLPGSGKPMRFGALLRIEVSHPRDVLWAMEEGAACAGLGAVVGEIHGNPAVLDFTATKRLALRAEASGVPVWLIRSHDAQGLSAARQRWRIGALPSLRHPHDAGAPGAPQWRADLIRAQGRPPGTWISQHEPGAKEDRLHLVPASGDGAVEDRGAARQDASGE